LLRWFLGFYGEDHGVGGARGRRGRKGEG